jgi:hypothetical protein
MQMNKILQPSVGADVSRPSPIYRPSVDALISEMILLKHNQIPTDMLLHLWIFV